MISLEGLNTPQLEAVTSIEGSVLLLAGAGTGKTRVICYRIAHMLDKGINPSSIVAMTFTNKAAREMSERIKVLTNGVNSGVRIGTFHSFCLELLRAHYKEAGLARGFRLIGSSEQVDMVRRSIEENRLLGAINAEYVHSRISMAKNYLLSPDDIEEGWDDVLDSPTLSELYSMYERQLLLNRVIDFDDCIYKTVKLLKTNTIVRDKLREKYKYLLVDEFQDTNYAQLCVVEELAVEHKNVCVVGDDDQSIYSWRGALSSTFNKFEEIFSGTKIIKLEQNYRCTNKILMAANAVIRNNKARMDKTLWSNSRGEHDIVFVSHKDEGEEGGWIARRCMALFGKGYKPKDVAVLYRANVQSKSIEVAMRENNIFYKVFGGQSFFEKKEVKDFLAYLSLISDQSARYQFWRVINVPSRGVGLKTLEKISQLADVKKTTPLAVLLDPALGLNVKTREQMELFVENIKRLAQMPLFTSDDVEKLCKEVIRTFRIDVDIRLKTSNEASRERKLDNLRRLPSWFKDISAQYYEKHGKIDVLDIIDALTLSELEQDADNTNNNYVSLMTVHSAKGLEFPVVFICGLEEELFPHKNSFTVPHGVEEERRLFYVAMTRAKQHLILSRSLFRTVGMDKIIRKQSRFIKEIPQEFITKEGEDEAAKPEQQKQNTLGRLAKIRSELRPSLREK